MILSSVFSQPGLQLNEFEEDQNKYFQIKTSRIPKIDRFQDAPLRKANQEQNMGDAITRLRVCSQKF